MTTIEEQVSMMDWLRRHGGIGGGCVDGDDPATGCHLPEHCEAERQEYLYYVEGELRAGGASGEGVYSIIRRSAKDGWRLLYAEDYDGPVMQRRVRDYIDSAGMA